jgi:mRNA interferase RelE/StbE
VSWKVSFDPAAEKQLGKLCANAQRDILRYLAKNLETAESQRRFGKPYLSVKGAWRYRVGDFRLVCSLRDQQLIVLLIKVGHRRNVHD